MIKLKQTVDVICVLVACIAVSSSTAQPLSSSQPSALPSSQTTMAAGLKSSSVITTLQSKALDPLPVEAAFALSANRLGSEIYITFKVAPTYYLYKEKIHVSVLPTATASKPVFPKGIIQYDASFAKELETYRNALQLVLSSVTIPKDGIINIDVHSQGCADLGICYPPQLQRISFSAQQTNPSIRTLDYVPFEANGSGLSNVSVAKPSIIATPSTLPASGDKKAAQSVDSEALNQPTQANTKVITLSPNANINEASLVVQENMTIRELLMNRSAAWLMLGFFGFGLLLTFTPCVLPMVPIVSAIVLGSAQRQTQRADPLKAADTKPWQGLSLSAAYVTGMVCVYTALGLTAGLAGAALSAYLQHPVLIAGFVALMLVLAGAQFGWYDVSPMRWFSANHTPLHSGTGLLRYASVAGMGAVSAVMVGPCITAPLAGVLGFIAQTGDAWTGALALFSLAMGMGVPLLLLGAGGARYLPKSGAWLAQMSHGFGIMLTASAIWLAQSLLPTWVSTVLWLGLIVLLAEWLGAFRPWPLQAQRATRLKNALAYLCVVWASLIVVGMAMGRFDALAPLAGLYTDRAAQPSTLASAPSSKPTFQTVNAQDLERTMQNTGQQAILLDIYADWCVSCIEFERFTFSDRAVASAMTQFKLLKVDVTRNTPADQALLKKLALFGPPAIVFYAANGQELEGMRVIGSQKAPAFLQHLNQILKAVSIPRAV